MILIFSASSAVKENNKCDVGATLPALLNMSRCKKHYAIDNSSLCLSSVSLVLTEDDRKQNIQQETCKGLQAGPEANLWLVQLPGTRAVLPRALPALLQCRTAHVSMRSPKLPFYRRETFLGGLRNGFQTES